MAKEKWLRDFEMTESDQKCTMVIKITESLQWLCLVLSMDDRVNIHKNTLAFGVQSSYFNRKSHSASSKSLLQIS